MRRLVFTFIFAAVAVTSAAAQTPPVAVMPVSPGQTPPPPAQTPPRTTLPPTVPVTPPPGQQGPTLPPPSRPPDTTPPVVPVQSNRWSNNVDVRTSGRTWQNIAVEITITDSVNASATTSVTKTANMLVLDGESGQVRSAGAGTINVDVLPSVRPDGRIFLRMTLEYLPDLSSSQQTQTQNASRTSFNQSLSLILVPNKKVLVSQTSDPKSDRQVTVHITAAVEK